MNTLDLAKLREHVNVTIVDFHESRIKILKNFKLRDLLKKLPYMF